MYPAEDLKRLAARKATLRRNIAFHRAQCESSASRLAQPVEWLDKLLAFWRRLAPLVKLAAAPVAVIATRTVFSRLKFLRPFVRWAPILFSAVRVIRAAKTHSASR